MFKAILIATTLLATIAQTDEAYTLSYGEPEDVGLSQGVLKGALSLYQESVARGEVVGAVILIARHGRVVAHQALGWSNSAGESSSTLEEQRQRFIEAMDDDLNSSGGLAVLFELARPLRALANRLERGDAISSDDQALEVQWQLLQELAGVLGLSAEASAEAAGADDSERISALIEARKAAKANKDYGEADRIRAELKAEGIELIDKPGGITDWIRA